MCVFFIHMTLATFALRFVFLLQFCFGFSFATFAWFGWFAVSAAPLKTKWTLVWCCWLCVNVKSQTWIDESKHLRSFCSIPINLIARASASSIVHHLCRICVATRVCRVFVSIFNIQKTYLRHLFIYFCVCRPPSWPQLPLFNILTPNSVDYANHRRAIGYSPGTAVITSPASGTAAKMRPDHRASA